jgi:hypothetical protein
VPLPPISRKTPGPPPGINLPPSSGNLPKEDLEPRPPLPTLTSEIDFPALAPSKPVASAAPSTPKKFSNTGTASTSKSAVGSKHQASEKEAESFKEKLGSPSSTTGPVKTPTSTRSVKTKTTFSVLNLDFGTTYTSVLPLSQVKSVQAEDKIQPPSSPSVGDVVETNTLPSSSTYPSRAPSPTTSLYGSVTITSKKKENKSKKAKKKELEQDLKETIEETVVEEHSPILGRKKKAKKIGSGPPPSLPKPVPAVKAKKESLKIKEDKPPPPVSVEILTEPTKEEEVVIATPKETPAKQNSTTPPITPKENPYKVLGSDIILPVLTNSDMSRMISSTSHTRSSDGKPLSLPLHNTPEAVAVIRNLAIAGSKTEDELLAAPLTAAEADSLQRGESIRRSLVGGRSQSRSRRNQDSFYGTAGRYFRTPRGTVVKHLSEKEENRFAELEERILAGETLYGGGLHNMQGQPFGSLPNYARTGTAADVPDMDFIDPYSSNFAKQSALEGQGKFFLGYESDMEEFDALHSKYPGWSPSGPEFLSRLGLNGEETPGEIFKLWQEEKRKSETLVGKYNGMVKKNTKQLTEALSEAKSTG